MTLRSQALSGIRWTVGARLTAQLVTWTITLLVIRILTPADYGLLAMATVFVAFVSMFSEFGLGPAVVQKADVEVTTLRQVFGVVVVVHGLLAAFVFATAPFVAEFYAEVRVVPIVRVLALQLVLAAFAVIPDAVLQRRMDFRRRSLLDLSGAIVGSAATLGLAFAGHGVWSLVVGSLLVQAWKTVGLNIVAPFRHWPRFSMAGMRSIVSFGGNVTAAQVLWYFYTQIDVVIAGRWLGNAMVGYYSVAAHLASLPNQRIAGIVNQVAFPAFARVQDDIAAIGRHLLLGVRVLGFVAFPVLWGVSSIAPEVVVLVLGPKWGAAALPLQVLGLIMPLRLIGNFVPNAVQGIGRTDILLKNAIFASVVMPAAFLVGVQWGLAGLSASWLFAAPAVFLQSMVRSLPAIGLDLRRLGRAMAPAVASCIIMYATVSLARIAIPEGIEGWLRLGLLVVAGAVSYVAASVALNRAGARDFAALLRGLLRP